MVVQVYDGPSGNLPGGINGLAVIEEVFVWKFRNISRCGGLQKLTVDDGGEVLKGFRD